MDDYYEIDNHIMEELKESFDNDTISAFLSELGLIEMGDDGFVVPFKRLIYIDGDTKEVYLEEERNYIKLINNVILFSDVKRRTAKTSINCRCIAAELPDSPDAVSSAVLFMKIVNKALKGFTCFLMHIDEELYMGCRLFNSIDSADCTLIRCDDYESLADQLMWVNDDFLSYYECVTSALTPRPLVPDFEEDRRRKQGRQYAYLNTLDELEKYSGESLERERNRYISSFLDDEDAYFTDQLANALEDYKHIQSSDVNTLELLFEAEEIEKLNLMEKDEETNSSSDTSGGDSEQYSLMNEYRNDPEGLIRELAKRNS